MDIRRISIKTALLVGGMVIGLGVSWILLPRLATPEGASGGSSVSEPEPVTVLVEEGQLREVVQFQGVVEPRTTITIQAWSPIGASRPVVTYVANPPAQVGSGQPIVALSGRPLIFLPGTISLYRDLHRGMSGPDVAQIQRNLVELGLLGKSDDGDGIFGPTTEEAVASLYQQIGFAPAPPPNVADEVALLEAQNAVDRAKALLKDANATGSAVEKGIAKRELEIAQAQFTSIADGPRLILPAAEVLVLPYDSVQVDESSQPLGALVDPEKPLLTVHTEDLIISAKGSRTQASSVRVGQTASILNQDAPIETIVEGLEVNPEDPDEVLLSFSAPDGSLLGDEVIEIEIEIASTDKEVLSVPLSAIRTDADGTTYVTVLEGQGSQRVSVDVGMIVGGRVEVRGNLQSGSMVVVGSG